MASSTERRPELSDEQFERLVALIVDADSVELKPTVPVLLDGVGARDGSSGSADPPGVLLRHTGSRVDRQGVVVRARRVQKKGDDSVVKLRPVIPSELPRCAARRASPSRWTRCRGVRLLRVGQAGVAADRRQGGGCGGQGDPQARRSSALLRGKRPEGVELDDLTVLGPIFVLKLKFSPEGPRARWSPSCGCTRMALGFSSRPPSAHWRKRSRSRPRHGRTYLGAASTSPASNRPRPAPRSSSSHSPSTLEAMEKQSYDNP